MAGNGEIRLDPDVPFLGGAEGRDGRIPLSDLYGLPVFAEAAGQKAKERRMEEEQSLEEIRREVFRADSQGIEEWIQEIRSQIFRALPDCQPPGGTEAGRPAPEPAATGLAAAESTEMIPGVFLSLGMAVIAAVLVHRRRKGKNRQ